MRLERLEELSSLLSKANRTGDLTVCDWPQTDEERDIAERALDCYRQAGVLGTIKAELVTHQATAQAEVAVLSDRIEAVEAAQQSLHGRVNLLLDVAASEAT